MTGTIADGMELLTATGVIRDQTGGPGTGKEIIDGESRYALSGKTNISKLVRRYL
jgi:hypothetical protein